MLQVLRQRLPRIVGYSLEQGQPDETPEDQQAVEEVVVEHHVNTRIPRVEDGVGEQPHRHERQQVECPRGGIRQDADGEALLVRLDERDHTPQLPAEHLLVTGDGDTIRAHLLLVFRWLLPMG